MIIAIVTNTVNFVLINVIWYVNRNFKHFIKYSHFNNSSINMKSSTNLPTFDIDEPNFVIIKIISPAIITQLKSLLGQWNEARSIFRIFSRGQPHIYEGITFMFIIMSFSCVLVLVFLCLYVMNGRLAYVSWT